ncbi:MAG: NAD(P)H-hydrate dehydratase [Clostridia bacterium]|nr:NAD(P)H-hydrate dehydratase [Clostridia bacterium]
MLVLTAENIKMAEESAVKNGCNYYDLMKTAGTECADVISLEDKNSKVTVLCGKGRNGGDGLVIAGRLWQNGFRNVFVVLAGGMPTDELCIQMYEEMVKYPVVVTDFTTDRKTAVYHIETADIIADALFGIGFRGELSGNYLEAVEIANKNTTAKKYAIDIPSGLSADGIYNEKTYFISDETLTMIAFKPVHVIKPSSDMCGKVTVIDIGIKEEILFPFAEKYTAFTKEEALNSINKRTYDCHKGTFANVLTICGSRNMTGCVYLCNQAAVEIGAGLVTAAFPECIYNTVTAKLNEPLMLPLKNNDEGRMTTDAKTLLPAIKRADVIAIGCGLGVDNDTKELVSFVINNYKGILILDADALNCVAKNTEILKNAECDIVITPHPGEMTRLTDKCIQDIQNNRMQTALDFANEYGVTILLKGANTVIADKTGRCYINTTGNPSMARGGSGDVLTGLIAGLISQTEDTFTAVCTGAFIHGMTADNIVKKYGPLAATPTRIINELYL